jgi:toxin ParE1/3/4
VELADNPEQGPLQPAYGEHVRGVPLRPYMILYRVSGEDVFVERIVHGARLPTNIR